MKFRHVKSPAMASMVKVMRTKDSGYWKEEKLVHNDKLKLC